MLEWIDKVFIPAKGEPNHGDFGYLTDAPHHLPLSEQEIPLPLVTVIIPCYNQGPYLWESVASAYGSYSGPLDVIVIDDGSTEAASSHNIREIQKFFPDVRLYRQENQGLSATRNNGLRYAKGDFIQFLDADDFLAPGKIDAQIRHLATFPVTAISICNFLLCDSEGKTFSKPVDTILGYHFTLHDFLFSWERGLTIPLHCALFPRRIFSEFSFDEQLSAKEDWLLWCSIAAKGYRLRYLDTHAAVYRKHEKAMTSTFFRMSKSWLLAAVKIDRFVGEQFPDFMDASVDWLNKYYRSHPQYKKELDLIKNQGAAPGPAHLPPAGEIYEITAEWTFRFSQSPVFKGDPQFTIIVPVFNHYEYLKECLESILRQGEVKVEIICIDDASADPRVGRLLAGLAERSSAIKIISHALNQGISSSQKEAALLAKGEFLAFLDCDDYLADKALEIVQDHINTHPEVDYFFTDRRVIDSQGKVLHDAIYGNVKLSDNLQDELLDRMIASHLKVIRRATYLLVDGDDGFYSGVQDWETALRISERSKLLYIPRVLYYHRLHKTAVTSTHEVSQAKKSNCVRRLYAEKWLRHGRIAPAEHDRISHLLASGCIGGIDSLPQTAVFSFSILSKSWFCPPEIKSAWNSGKICIFDARGPLDPARENFLREFNSYFDHIICDHAEVSASLIGHLWSPAILWSPLKLTASASPISPVVRKHQLESHG